VGAPFGLPDERVDGVILLALVTSATIALLVLGVRHLQLRRAAREWRSAELDGVRVLLSESAGPAVFGWRRAQIVLPRWVCGMEAPQRRLVVSHECEHLQAHDSLLMNVARVLLALVPWNPLAWVVHRRLQLAVEVDCDARVLARHRDVLGYAEVLVSAGERTGVGRLRVALTEPSSFLSRRITAMLTRPFRSPRLVGLAAAVAGAALLAVACMTREPVGVPGARPVEQAPEMVVSGDTSKPFFEFQVEEPVNAIPGAAPRYPDSLRTAGVEGEVLVQFVVDAQGVPDVSTFKVLRATRAEFAEAVRLALGGMRFTAARKDGRAVKQLVQQPFVFSIAK
jgi:TonB family protein